MNTTPIDYQFTLTYLYLDDSIISDIISAKNWICTKNKEYQDTETSRQPNKSKM